MSAGHPALALPPNREKSLWAKGTCPSEPRTTALPHMSLMPRLRGLFRRPVPPREALTAGVGPPGLRVAEGCSLARVWLQCPHLPLQLDGAGWQEKEGRD